MSSDQWSLDPLGYGHVSSLGHMSTLQRVQCSLALEKSLPINYNLLWLINYLSNKSPILGTFPRNHTMALLLVLHMQRWQKARARQTSQRGKHPLVETHGKVGRFPQRMRSHLLPWWAERNLEQNKIKKQNY